MKKTIILASVVAMAMSFVAQAVEVTVHPTTKYGATHEVTLDYSMFTTTTTNTAEVLTWNVSANTAYELMCFQLNDAFVGAAGTDSLAITVGDGTDADLFLTSTEFAGESTEVYAGFGRKYASTTLGFKLYTAADTIDFTCTPNAENSTSAYTAGKVTFYFREI